MSYFSPLYLYIAVQLFWVAGSGWWLVKRRDELPLIASVFLFYVFSFRFWALLQGWTSPVNISNFGFENPTFEGLLEADGFGVLGQSVFLLAYCFTQKRKLEIPENVAPSGTINSVRAVVF